MNAQNRSRRRFDAIFARIAASETLSTIWRGVYRDDYPEGATPFSFVTVPELRLLAAGLNLSMGDMLVDLACGSGGPGLWLARETGATLVGVDSSMVALGAAAVRRFSFGLSTAAFVAADAGAIALRSSAADAVMSVDALQLMPHRTSVLNEIARVLKPCGRFAFTTWLSRGGTGAPPFPMDYQPLLDAVGLTTMDCEEPRDWFHRELEVFAQIREQKAILSDELGSDVAAMLVAEAEKLPNAYAAMRRVNIIATKAG